MKRAIGMRFKEHIYGILESSSVAQPVKDTGYNIKVENLELIKNVNLLRKLNNCIMIYIFF